MFRGYPPTMHWDSTKIRDLADRMDTKPKGFSVSAETKPLIVAALRFYAKEGLAEPIRDLAYSIDVWDDRDNLIEHIGKISNLMVARAAFDAAVLERPGKPVTLRQGARVVRTTKGVRAAFDGSARSS